MADPFTIQVEVLTPKKNRYDNIVYRGIRKDERISLLHVSLENILQSGTEHCFKIQLGY